MTIIIVQELARACEPSLPALLREVATGQLALPLYEVTARDQAERVFARTLRLA
jgi:type III restriction enzyme